MTTVTGAIAPQPQGIYDASGTFVRTVRRIVRVVGPASYAAGGFQVDCSTYFSSIVKATFLRRYTTATGVSIVTRGCSVGEAGTDLYSAAKFRGISLLGGAHTHNYDKTNTPTNGPSGNPTSFGVDNAHTHVLTYTATASGAASNQAFAEDTAGVNLSTSTYEFEVEGVSL